MKSFLKPILSLSILLVSLCFAQCKKEKVDSNGLPSATQSGANTFGFLLNGKPWVPWCKMFGIDNLSDYVDFSFRNGVFGISA